ncbi:transposon Tf2-9 polyprotein [Trichonephila clavata]|uniref:Transposon Tf2-9 polyprotein n=1 Tax=Trichonephila clavata TaxID=2740835 RepID=A0A8X6KWU8_TRICU|nr:transposon Tf2-9 polyprotein [Trichonephila clavata]
MKISIVSLKDSKLTLDVQNVPIANRAKVFVSSLSAKLYQLLKNLLVPDIPPDQPLDKLKDALKKHLTPKPLIIPSRHKFLNRKQNEGEGISTYIAELSAVAMNCDYDKDMLNIMLRDVFVSELRDKMILDRLFEEDNINLEKTLNIALTMEKAFKGANDIMGRGINSMQTFKKHMDKKSNFTKNQKKTLYCSRCTGTNHAKENCRFISSKCNFCGKIGRIKQACFAFKKANAKPVKQKQVTLLDKVGDKNRIPQYESKIQYCVLHEEEPKRPPIMINLKIENKSCSMELDTEGASFEFDIIFRKTIEHGNADFLSRLPKTSEELEVKDDITILQMSQIEALPVTSKELRQETGKDIELGPLLKALREDKDIEEAAKNCVDCARYKADPTKANYWEYPSMPWERIHVDFAGPIFEHTFFLIVDAHSKWLEVYPMKTTTTKKTIECLRESFARFGLPRVLVSDNGSQFTPYEFQRFMQRNGVKHKTSAPFKTSCNGQAERYVATLKQSLRAMHKYIYIRSPAMLFLKRDIRTRIDLLLPELKTKIQDKLRRDNFKFRDRKCDVGDRVAVRVYKAANTRWKFGTIVNQDGVLHYIIDVQGILVRRHVDQIRPVGDQVQETIIPIIHQRFPSAGVRENNSDIQHAETAEDISKDPNKELGSSSVQGVPSTDVSVPDLSQSLANEIDSETRSPPVPDRPFPKRSGRIRRPPERLVL